MKHLSFFILLVSGICYAIPPGYPGDSTQWKKDSLMITLAYNEIIKDDISAAAEFLQRGSDLDMVIEEVGIDLMEGGHNDKAIQLFKYNITRLQGKEKHRWLSRSYGLVASIYGNLHDYESKLSYSKKSLEEILKTTDSSEISVSYMSLQLAYAGIYRYDSSRYCGIKSLEIAEARADTFMMSNIYSNFVLMHQMKREPDSMDYYLFVMEDMLNNYFFQTDSFRVDPDPRVVYKYSWLMSSLSLVNRNKGNVKESLDYAEKGLYFANQVGNNGAIMDAYRKTAEAYRKAGEYEIGWGYLEKYLGKLNKSYNENIVNKVKELDVKYETQQKEQEIILLNKENEIKEAELKQKNTVISASIIGGGLLLLVFILILFLIRNRGKKRELELEHQVLRTQMNPHFIFNSLNSIQRLYVEGEFDMADDYMADFSDLIRETLDNSDRKTVTLKEDIKTLDLYLNMEKMRTKNKFDFTIEIANDIDLGITRVPPFIIQPFVENSIWHGIMPSDQTGEITVKLSRENNKLLRCEIRDNGVGMGAVKSKGKKHESKALSIVEERIGVTDAILFPEVEEGTLVEVLIPFTV